jgi:hypothetical protein
MFREKCKPVVAQRTCFAKERDCLLYSFIQDGSSVMAQKLLATILSFFL